MPRSRWSALVVVAFAAALSSAGCSNSKNPHAFNNGTSNGGNGGSGGGGGSGGATSQEAGSGHCANTTRPSNDAFCYTPTCNPALDCSRVKEGPVDNCCVLTAKPPTSPELVRTTNTKKYADPNGGPPDLSCFQAGHYPPKPPSGTPPLVTMQGKVTAFANGCDMVGVKIAIYKVQRTGDPATDGQLGQLVGTPVVTSSSSPIFQETVSTCNNPRNDRKYTYPNVPMYTDLVVETSAATVSDPWSPLYTYNIYITPSDPNYVAGDAGSGTYNYDPEALAASDFQTIPTVAGINNITPGNGAIGGEIHDCGNIRLQNATVGVSAPARALVYFNDVEDNPLPDVSRMATGTTALYAALDMAPGFVRVSAAGTLNGKLVSLGYYDVRVFANSVTAVSLQGLRPFQEP